MRLLVVGRQGQLACSLAERTKARGITGICVGRPELDLSAPDTIADTLTTIEADLIINAAAFTAVDKAEQEQELAQIVNAAAPSQLAVFASQRGIPIIQISTDYVFDGRADRPYREDDNVSPLGIYGATKAAGERAVAAITENHVILRTGWIYSPFHSNFVKTMLRLAETRDEISVVCDQIGAPTSALDLADAIVDLAYNLIRHPDDATLRGTFHAVAGWSTSWADFARLIFDEAKARGGPYASVRSISTADYPTPARRPAYSVLDTARLRLRHGISLPEGRASVAECVARLVSPEKEKG